MALYSSVIKTPLREEYSYNVSLLCQNSLKGECTIFILLPVLKKTQALGIYSNPNIKYEFKFDFLRLI